MPTYEAPSREAIMRNYKERRNWGRWGDDDPAGAINLITVEKRLAALASVQNGRTVSLSRPYPKDPSAINPTPAQHFIRTFARGDDGSGAVVDYYGFIYHGHTFTHIDALLPHLGPGRHLAGPPTRRSDRLGDRRDLRRRDRLESGHLHPRRVARRAQVSRRALRHLRPARDGRRTG